MRLAEKVNRYVESVAKANGMIVDDLLIGEIIKEDVLYDVYLEASRVNSEGFNYYIYGVNYDGEILEMKSGFLKHDEVLESFA